MNTKGKQNIPTNFIKSVFIFILFFSFISINVKSQEICPSNFEVISAQVVVDVDGVNKGLTWKDNEDYKPVVLLIKADCPTDIELFACDFELKYYIKSDKEWSRSRCMGMSTTVSSAEDNVLMVVNHYASFVAKKGIRYFKVFFPLENGVEEISLMYAKPVVENFKVNRM